MSYIPVSPVAHLFELCCRCSACVCVCMRVCVYVCLLFVNACVCVCVCSHVRHNSFICVTSHCTSSKNVTWLIHIIVAFYLRAPKHVTWLVPVCDMTHSCVWFIRVTWHIQMRDKNVCATWLIHMCDMTHSYVWHDSFIRVTWHIQMRDKSVTAEETYVRPMFDKSLLPSLLHMSFDIWLVCKQCQTITSLLTCDLSDV